MSGLNVRTEPSELDFLALGALIHRLDPGVIPFRKARSFEVHVSGGEYNVAANLSDCFGLRTGLATAMVKYPIGELVQGRLRETGVTPYYKWFEHDGVRGPNLATVYSDRGQGVRAPVVFYNRSNEAAAQLRPGDFDWAKIFAGGVRWFHSGGIFAALSETTSELIIEGMQAARASGAINSFDLNYRAKLWASVGGEAKGQQVIRRIVSNVDALVGNEEDLQKGLGIEGPEVQSESKLDPETFFKLIERVVEKHPNVKLVATTLREVHSTNRHDWGAVLWLDGKRYVSPTCHLDVLDRIGGGDGFASGLFYGLLSGRPPEEALRLGWAHGALLTTFPGDITMAKLNEVEAFAKGGSARVQRSEWNSTEIAPMLTALGCAARRQRLWEALSTPCDALVVADPSHLIYFAGYAPSPFVFRTVESGALLLLEPGRATLVADNLLGAYVESAHVDERVAPVWYAGERPAPHRRAQLAASALGRLARMPGQRLGIELASVPAGVVEGLRTARPGLQIVDISPIIRPLRRAKDGDELAVIRRAIHAGEAAHAAALVEIKPGMTELDAYQVVQRAAISALGEAAIVYGDFVSGPRCAREKGGPPSARTIERGDLLLLDFSVVVGGYRGDFTNTFAVGAPPTSRQRTLFAACIGALQAGEAVLKPGTPARAVEAAVRGHFAALGLDHAFTTHTGHGIGLGHPEPPYFVPGSDETLVEGDVVAIEPGLYIEGEGGMRYERNYRITADGFETLSNHELRIEQ